MIIELGYRVKDKITGFTGIVIGKSAWLHGCTRVGVQPQEMFEGKPIEAQWFDEPQLEFVDEGLYVNAKPERPLKQVEPPGGPHRDAPRRADPKR